MSAEIKAHCVCWHITARMSNYRCREFLKYTADLAVLNINVLYNCCRVLRPFPSVESPRAFTGDPYTFP